MVIRQDQVQPLGPIRQFLQQVHFSRMKSVLWPGLQKLFPSYQLPSGKKAFFYYAAGRMVDEVAVPPCDPPPRPTSVPQALQQTMPLAQVSNPVYSSKFEVPFKVEVTDDVRSTPIRFAASNMRPGCSVHCI